MECSAVQFSFGTCARKRTATIFAGNWAATEQSQAAAQLYRTDRALLRRQDSRESLPERRALPPLVAAIAGPLISITQTEPSLNVFSTS